MSKLSILIAYPYFTQKHADFLRNQPRDNYRLIIDSGAFTAWNSGHSISLDDYCRFLDSIEHLRPFNAVQLDVFGEPEATYQNLLEMRRRGYDVMPVFTRGDTLERLNEFYEMTNYIMFGGIVIGGQNQNYVKWFLENNRGRMAHWLGFVDMDFIKHYRPESVDSSSWNSGARYGNLSLYVGGGKIKNFNKNEFRTRPSDELLRIASANGLKPAEVFALSKALSWVNAGYADGLPALSGDLINTGAKSLAVSVGAVAHVLRSHHVEEQVGTKVYLAASQIWQVNMLFGARNFLKERGIIR